jgi:hypothetical protein
LNNEENAKFLSRAKSKFKRAKIFGVDDNAGFNLIERVKDKKSVLIIFN